MKDAQRVVNAQVYDILSKKRILTEISIQRMTGLPMDTIQTTLAILQEHNLAARSKDFWVAIEIGAQ